MNQGNNQNTGTLDVAGIAAELAQVQETKKRYEDREKQLKAALRTLGEGKYAAGNLKLSIFPNRRIDPEKVAAAYPSETYPHFYDLKPNLEIVKRSVPPAMYDAMMQPVGDLIVKVS